MTQQTRLISTGEYLAPKVAHVCMISLRGSRLGRQWESWLAARNIYVGCAGCHYGYLDCCYWGVLLHQSLDSTQPGCKETSVLSGGFEGSDHTTQIEVVGGSIHCHPDSIKEGLLIHQSCCALQEHKITFGTPQPIGNCIVGSESIREKLLIMLWFVLFWKIHTWGKEIFRHPRCVGWTLVHAFRRAVDLDELLKHAVCWWSPQKRRPKNFFLHERSLSFMCWFLPRNEGYLLIWMRHFMGFLIRRKSTSHGRPENMSVCRLPHFTPFIQG